MFEVTAAIHADIVSCPGDLWFRIALALVYHAGNKYYCQKNHQWEQDIRR